MKVFVACILIVGAVVAHFFALQVGIYATQMQQGVVWFDNVLHATVGVAFGLLWLSFFKKIKPEASFFAVAASVVLFVLAIAIAWEAFEYGFYLLFKSGALGLTVYMPSLNEAIFDSLSNIGGALLVLAGYYGIGVFATARNRE